MHGFSAKVAWIIAELRLARLAGRAYAQTDKGRVGEAIRTSRLRLALCNQLRETWANERAPSTWLNREEVGIHVDLWALLRESAAPNEALAHGLAAAKLVHANPALLHGLRGPYVLRSEASVFELMLQDIDRWKIVAADDDRSLLRALADDTRRQ